MTVINAITFFNRLTALLKIKPEGIIHLQKDKSNINYSLLCNSKHLTFIAA